MRRAIPLVTLLLAACGGPSTPGPRAGGDGEGAGSDGPCGPHRVQLGGEHCWSAEGTRWHVEADGPGGTYRFDVQLLAAGRVRSTDHGAASPATDEWFQDGDLLRVFLSDRFVEYRARITNGTVLIGEAHNVRGQQWSWRADREFGEASCAEGEARVDGACLTVLGTRWRVEPEGGDPRFVEFLADGRVGTDAEGDDATGADEWTQDGARLRFTLGEGEARFEAELTDDAELRGTWRAEGGPRPWTATRVESIPPVVRR